MKSTGNLWAVAYDDPDRAEQVRAELQAQAGTSDQTISRLASSALAELDNRIVVGSSIPRAMPATGTSSVPPPSSWSGTARFPKGLSC